MHRKHLLTIILITLFTFSPCLGNHFVGDDEVIFLNNVFYQDLSHAKDLFTEKYTSARTNTKLNGQPYHSGSVAYRPVLSATYFADDAVWGLNPFGYHLTNVLLHIFNVCLVYGLVCLLGYRRQIAFAGALLFAVHPIQVEAVNNIGYRADVLVVFWMLLCVWCYVHQQTKYKLFSLLAFFLALFTKESAFMLPFWICGYDILSKNKAPKWSFMTDGKWYGGFAILMVFYLYVYVMIFPNTSLTFSPLLSLGIVERWQTALTIFMLYGRDFFFPWQVTVLPPLYMPSGSLLGVVLGFAGASGAAITFSILFKKRDRAALFVFWFFIMVLPVSNIIPLANPMAHRFMYAPFVGLSVLGAFILIKWKGWFQRKGSPFLFRIILLALIGVCVATSFSLSCVWKDTLTVAEFMKTRYPDNAKVFGILGMTYLQKGQPRLAWVHLRKAADLGSQDPRVYYHLQQLSPKFLP